MLHFSEGRGDPSKPAGTLIAFAEVDGHNPVTVGARYLAVHIVVSSLAALRSHYPVVVFPPAAYKDRNQLDHMIDFSGLCDVIQLPVFCVPAGMSDEEYIQKRMDDLNQIVEDYVDLVQKSFARLAQEQGWQITPLDLDFDEPEEDMDLGSSLRRLERLIERKAAYESYTPVIHYIKSHHPELDVWNFEQLVRNARLDVAALYVQKFRAIAEERYEAAAFFQTRIEDMGSAGTGWSGT